MEKKMHQLFSIFMHILDAVSIAFPTSIRDFKLDFFFHHTLSIYVHSHEITFQNTYL